MRHSIGARSLLLASLLVLAPLLTAWADPPPGRGWKKEQHPGQGHAYGRQGKQAEQQPAYPSQPVLQVPLPAIPGVTQPLVGGQRTITPPPPPAARQGQAAPQRAVQQPVPQPSNWNPPPRAQ